MRTTHKFLKAVLAKSSFYLPGLLTVDFSLLCELLEGTLGKEPNFLQLTNVRNFITDNFKIILYFNKKQSPFPDVSFGFEFVLQSRTQE